MFEGVSVAFSTVFIILTTILSTYPKYFPSVHHSLPWLKKANVALALDTNRDGRDYLSIPSRLEIHRSLLTFIRNIVALVAVIEPLLIAIVHLISISSSGDLLDAEFDSEPSSPISPIDSSGPNMANKDITESETTTEAALRFTPLEPKARVETPPESRITPRTRKDAILSSASASSSVIPVSRMSYELRRTKSNADLGALLAAEPFGTGKSTGQSTHKGERKPSNDCLLRKLGRNRINRKFQEIRDLYPLLNLCQTVNHRTTAVTTHPRRRKSDEDLSFLENMHKVLRTLSVKYNRPQNQYRVERIVTVPSLLDVAESEERFLKATLDIVADFETAYDGSASSWRKSVIQIDSTTTSKTPKDAWITWGLARNPLLADAVKQEFSRVIEETQVPSTGPAVIELPYFTAVVKEGLRRRTIVSDPVAETKLSEFPILTQNDSFSNPRTYDPTRWLPENSLGLSGMNKRTSGSWDGTWSYPQSGKSFSEIQIFAVTPSIVRRARAVSGTTEDISSMIAIDLLVITPNPRKPRLVPTLPGRGLYSL